MTVGQTGERNEKGTWEEVGKELKIQKGRRKGRKEVMD
jgi:hypothetical protein